MKRFSLLFILVLAVAAFGQEGMEAPMEEAAVDTMAMDEMLVADSTVVAEEAPVEDTGDALEAMLAEEGTTETEVTSGSAAIGYTVGLMGGYPVYFSGGMSNATANPVFGIIAATPFGFSAGPLEIGIGIELGYYDFYSNFDGMVALATLNTAVFETPQGPISVELGGGLYGASVGGTAGVTYSFAVPNMPLVIKPYVRANATLDSGVEKAGADDNNAVAWVNAGLYLSYDISTLF